MPFDPTLPQENTPIDAAQMRAQFNGLKTLIDAVPAGPPGPQGEPGEVTNQQLNDAVAGTSNNTNGVGTLGDSHADPVVQAIIDKLNEHILAARR